MLYRTIDIEELVDLKDADKAVVDLMENNNSHLKLIGLKKHQILEPHMSNTDVCIFVIDGEIELKFSNLTECTCQTCGCGMPDDTDEDFKKYKVKKGQMFFFEKDVTHSLEALKDSAFLAIKI